MQQFLANFSQAYNRLRCHGIIICDLFEFKLLKAAKSSNHHEQLIKTKTTKVNYEIFKKLSQSSQAIANNKIQWDMKQT